MKQVSLHAVSTVIVLGGSSTVIVLGGSSTVIVLVVLPTID